MEVPNSLECTNGQLDVKRGVRVTTPTFIKGVNIDS